MTFFGLVRNLPASAVRRRAAEAEAESTHLMLEAVIEGTTDDIFVKDVDGRFIAVNASAAQTVGRTREELIGRPTRSTGVTASAQSASTGSWQRPVLRRRASTGTSDQRKGSSWRSSSATRISGRGTGSRLKSSGAAKHPRNNCS